jgi:hypothetical protein
MPNGSLDMNVHRLSRLRPSFPVVASQFRRYLS